MRDLPVQERPREKLLREGAANLSDQELVAVLLGSGSAGQSVLELARRVVPLLDQNDPTRLWATPGIGRARAAALLAGIELGRRQARPVGPLLESAEEVYRHQIEMAELDREHFRALYLDVRHRLIHQETISIGTLTSSLVHPREVFGPALSRKAACLIVVHNHPSGDPTPSAEDLSLTRRLTRAGDLLGIELLDHVVIGRFGYTSIRGIPS